MNIAEHTGGIALTDEQRLDWLRLIRSENVGPRGTMAQTPEAIRRCPPNSGQAKLLLELELAGRLERQAGGPIALV